VQRVAACLKRVVSCMRKVEMSQWLRSEGAELPLYSPKPYANLRFARHIHNHLDSHSPIPQIIRFCLPELSLHPLPSCILPFHSPQIATPTLTISTAPAALHPDPPARIPTSPSHSHGYQVAFQPLHVHAIRCGSHHRNSNS